MKKDLRIIKSEAAIEAALLELIEEKGYANVRIVDIAKRANVNRNTIYLHYKDKEEIVFKIVSKSFEESTSLIDFDKIISSRASRKNVEELFINILNVLERQVELFRILLTDQNLSGYIARVSTFVRKMMFEVYKDTKENKMIVEYIIQGIYGVIKMWIIYDISSKDEVAKELANLVISNARRLQFKQR